MMNRTKKGFTLIELILVMAILGILAALVTGNFLSSIKRGHDAARKIDLSSMQKALESYYEDKSAYPLTITPGEELSSTNSDNAKQIYIVKIPVDPKSGAGYEYISDGTYYQMYACLENTEQTLGVLSEHATMSCATNCKDKDNNSVPCIYGVSSPNTTP